MPRVLGRRGLQCVTAVRAAEKAVKQPIPSLKDPDVHFLVNQVQSRLKGAVEAEEVRPPNHHTAHICVRVGPSSATLDEQLCSP